MVSGASFRVFCGVKLHSQLTDQSFEFVNALSLSIVRSSADEDLMSLLEKLSFPTCDNGFGKLILAKHLGGGGFALECGEGDLTLKT
jgi:hypothetical protein